MTREQLDKMTPEEKRIAISEACGWKFIFRAFDGRKGNVEIIDPFAAWKGAWYRSPYKTGSDREYSEEQRKTNLNRHLPDYLNDLNAMHEAEKMLKPEAQEMFWYEIEKIVKAHGDYEGIYGTEGFKMLHATAAQRAYAFLLSLEEGK